MARTQRLENAGSRPCPAVPAPRRPLAGRLPAACFAAAAGLLSFAAVPTAGNAADLQLGFINSERIFQEYQGRKEAEAELGADLEKWNQELDARKRELEKLVEDYESQSLILSEPRRREFEDEIQRKRTDMDAFVREIWGPTGKLAQRNEQLTRPILERISQAAAKIGEERGLSVIFDAGDGNVWYVDQALDLTDDVLQALNAQN